MLLTHGTSYPNEPLRVVILFVPLNVQNKKNSVAGSCEYDKEFQGSKNMTINFRFQKNNEEFQGSKNSKYSGFLK
jgi:hypothetical protein